MTSNSELTSSCWSVTIGDVSLSHEDVQSLAPGAFLSDLIISSAFQAVEHQQQQTASAAGSVRLVQPATVMMASCGIVGDDLASMVAPLGLDAADVVFLPVNDNDSPDRAYGGSHWSLVVFRRSSGSFHHYDSYGGHNGRVARRVCAAFATALGAPAAAAFVDETGATPQQGNGFDCGIHVICVAEALQRGDASLSDVRRCVETRRVELRRAIMEAVAAKYAQAPPSSH
jgi:sentrin-specific protease 8